MKRLVFSLWVMCLVASRLSSADGVEVIFGVGHGDTPAAVSFGEVLAADGESGVSLISSDDATSLAVTDREVSWEFLEPVEAPEGSLELIFKPTFAQVYGDGDEEVVLRLLDTMGDGLILVFRPRENHWVFLVTTPDGRRQVGWTAAGAVKEGEWQHFVLSWEPDGQQDGGTRFRFFFNGQGTRVVRQVMPKAPFSAVVVGGSVNAPIIIDELTLLNAPVTADQAEDFASLELRGEHRRLEIGRRIRADSRLLAQERAERENRVARLEGKVGRLIPWLNQKATDFNFPEGITARGIRVEEIGQVDLDQFDVIYFPEGRNYDLDPSQREIIANYVRNGGGYVGACAGSNFAHGLGLLDFNRHAFLGRGLLKIRLNSHPVTEGYGDSATLHHGNGPVMMPGSNVEVIGTYSLPQVAEHTFAAAITGEYGSGRVVLFGPHPLGGRIGSQQFSAESLGSARMFVNALLFAAGITGVENE